jgi:hypothetical protein
LREETQADLRDFAELGDALEDDEAFEEVVFVQL